MGQFTLIRDFAQIDIPTLLDVRTYMGSIIDIVFDKCEIGLFIVVIYKFKVYTRTYC